MCLQIKSEEPCVSWWLSYELCRISELFEWSRFKLFPEPVKPWFTYTPVLLSSFASAVSFGLFILKIQYFTWISIIISNIFLLSSTNIISFYAKFTWKLIKLNSLEFYPFATIMICYWNQKKRSDMQVK